MATWEDGPEYAPLQRPDAFDEPTAATVGLESPAPPASTPPAPPERPLFDGPTTPVPALETLVPTPPAGRDPEQPFEVVASVMTTETSAWASAHWTGRPSPSQSTPPVPAGPTQPLPYGTGAGFTTAAPTTIPAPTPVPTSANGSSPGHTNGSSPGRPPTSAPMPWPEPSAGAAYPPPTGQPTYPAPAAPQPSFPPPSPTFPSQVAGQPFPPPGQPPAPGPFPAPGTPQWFGPGGYQTPPPAPPTTPNARAVLTAATPGMLVTLAVGAFLWVLAPVTLVLAFVLSSRMTYGRKPTRTAYAAVLAFLGLVGVLSLITADGFFSDWWDSVAGWACFGSWVMIVATIIAVYRALKQGRPDPPPVSRLSRR